MPLKINKNMLEDPRVIEYGTIRLASGAGKYELKAELEKLFGGDCDVNQWGYEGYLTICTAKIAEVSDISLKHIANRLQTFLWSTIGDLEEGTKNKLLAVREMRRLYGLDRIDKGSEEQAKEIRDILDATDGLSLQKKVRDSRGTFRED